jgi:hypothetical protein
VLYGGDCGWDNELAVLPLKELVEALPALVGDTLLEQANSQGLTQTPIVAGRDGPIILGKSEQQWLVACMTAIRRRWPAGN